TYANSSSPSPLLQISKITFKANFLQPTGPTLPPIRRANYTDSLPRISKLMSIPQTPGTLLDVLSAAPGERTAILVPEANLRVSYDALRSQVAALADSLASAGIARGDRVAMALPNGLPAIVSFLAASIVGTAAPLNPAYRDR